MILAMQQELGRRSANLDALLSVEAINGAKCVILIDGYRCSKEAVTSLSKILADFFLNNSCSSAKEVLEGAQQADLVVNASVLIVVKYAGVVSIFSVGDCRAYSEEGELLTKDHSLAWELLVAKGAGSGSIEEAVSKHPYKNHLVRSFKLPGGGINGDLLEFDVGRYSRLLICTDGFWTRVSSRVDFVEVIGSLELEHYCSCLVESSDNSSVCIVGVD